MHSVFSSMVKPDITKLSETERIDFVSNVFYDWGDEDQPQIVKYLVDNGYFTAPASSRFHGKYPGGLFEHSYYVGYMLRAYTEYLNLKWERPGSPWIVGLLHDLCKIDLYKEVDNGWILDGVEKDYTYERSMDTIIPGHAEKSLIYALRHIDLTDEEIACIRYHMGAYEKNDWEGFDRAIRKYPNVLYTHMADMHASKIFGV